MEETYTKAGLDPKSLTAEEKEMKLKTWMKSALAVGALMSLTTGAFADGMLRYATVGEPPSLDQQVITSDLATTIAHHMFEGL
jgi:peptide/nickel transport system substrate-binding protein